jgi:predicted GNAT family N-acyltransferase
MLAAVAGTEVTIRWASGPAELDGALQLRERVFCREQGVPRELEVDGLDGRALHLLALEPNDARVIGTLRLLAGERVARIGRVEVEREWRRRGIATRMLALALGAAHERGCREARLAAQLGSQALYERVGFSVQSEPFEEAGMPHVWMGRALAGD